MQFHFLAYPPCRPCKRKKKFWNHRTLPSESRLHQSIHRRPPTRTFTQTCPRKVHSLEAAPCPHAPNVLLPLPARETSHPCQQPKKRHLSSTRSSKYLFGIYEFLSCALKRVQRRQRRPTMANITTKSIDSGLACTEHLPGVITCPSKGLDKPRSRLCTSSCFRVRCYDTTVANSTLHSRILASGPQSIWLLTFYQSRRR